MERTMSHHDHRRARTPNCLLVAAAAITLVPATVQAATSATGAQSVTADIANTLEATFPAAYGWGDLDAGAAGNTSSAQTVNVKSNATWGVKASTDQTGGQMKEWTGAAYVGASPKVLTNALNWRVSQIGAAPQATSFAAFTSTPALATGSQAVTGDPGVDVSFLYRQHISYADANAGSNDYRVLVNYDVAQGW
jgi:hypothetical protein